MNIFKNILFCESLTTGQALARVRDEAMIPRMLKSFADKTSFRPLAFTLIIFALFLSSSPFVLSQTLLSAGVDTVFSVRWGTGQDFGRDRFPSNVVGLPDTTARPDRPSNNPAQICSLGMGGEIVIGWKNAVLVNREEADFTVFENPFLRFDGKVFAEPAKIAVSRDGVRFVEFPFDSLTLRGCAGITPTNGNQNPFNSRVSGGDSFDLASIGIDSVRFVKITDISAMVLNNPRHPFYDPTISGFDLDAVVGLFLAPSSPSRMTSVRDRQDEFVRFQQSAEYFSLDFAESRTNAVCKLYSLQGALQLDFTAQYHATVSTAGLPRGAYFLVVQSDKRIWRTLFVLGG